MKTTILAFSSSGGSYPVEFLDDSGVLQVFCHCQAGTLQQMCKHKLALLKGDSKMLYDPAQEKLLQEVLASKAYPALKRGLDAYEKELTEIEREMAQLKEREKKLKAGFAYQLTHGRKRR
jgi:hypothetical protein